LARGGLGIVYSIQVGKSFAEKFFNIFPLIIIRGYIYYKPYSLRELFHFQGRFVLPAYHLKSFLGMPKIFPKYFLCMRRFRKDSDIFRRIPKWEKKAECFVYVWGKYDRSFWGRR